MSGPLAARDLDQFVELGYCVVRGAVPREVAERVVAELCNSMSSWVEPWDIALRSVYDMPTLVDALTTPVRRAFDQLAGRDGWHLAATWGFPVRSAGQMQPLWHIDGDWFTHHVQSGEQVLTPIFLWQDVLEEDGPTLLAPGSHRDVARLLAEHEPEGVPGDRIRELVHQRVRPSHVVSATGLAGDVFVCHPFLAHSFNPAGARQPRYVSNVAVHGPAPLRVDTSAGPLTPVELPIARALTR